MALVGYTNAGKSTLFNALTDGGVYAADQLFATLDPTVRRLDGLDCGPVVLADTVGFIRDLPHDLVAAFQSTLAEAREADLLLHVVDAADPRARRSASSEVDSSAAPRSAPSDVPQMLVFNKIDKLADDAGPPQPRFETIDGGRTSRVWVVGRAGDRPGSAARRDRAHAAGRTRAPLAACAGFRRPPACAPVAQGFVASERPAESGWELEIDAPRALIEPLFGLPSGEGEWLRQQLAA